MASGTDKHLSQVLQCHFQEACAARCHLGLPASSSSSVHLCWGAAPKGLLGSCLPRADLFSVVSTALRTCLTKHGCLPLTVVTAARPRWAGDLRCCRRSSVALQVCCCPSRLAQPCGVCSSCNHQVAWSLPRVAASIITLSSLVTHLTWYTRRASTTKFNEPQTPLPSCSQPSSTSRKSEEVRDDSCDTVFKAYGPCRA